MKPMHNYYEFEDGKIIATLDGSILDNSIHRSPIKQVSLDDKLLDGVRLKECLLGLDPTRLLWALPK